MYIEESLVSENVLSESLLQSMKGWRGRGEMWQRHPLRTSHVLQNSGGLFSLFLSIHHVE